MRPVPATLAAAATSALGITAYTQTTDAYLTLFHKLTLPLYSSFSPVPSQYHIIIIIIISNQKQSVWLYGVESRGAPIIGR